MTKTTAHYGRFANQVIRNLAVSFIARRHDLFVRYSSADQIAQIGIHLHVGTKLFETTLPLTDENYFDVLLSDSLRSNLNPNNNFFQTKAICNMIFDHLREEPGRSRIVLANPFRERYGANNDAGVHVRLTDAAKVNPGPQYYIDTLASISFDRLYIATDEPDHTTVRDLFHRWPQAELVTHDHIRTIQFMSTCKYLVLSGGSYSALIGYLGPQSQVYHPAYHLTKLWHGDMFSIPGWRSVGPNVKSA